MSDKKDMKLALSVMYERYYTNIKHGTDYITTSVAINCTNAQDGQVMIEYYKADPLGMGIKCIGPKLCREVNEFLHKFKPSV